MAFHPKYVPWPKVVGIRHDAQFIGGQRDQTPGPVADGYEPVAAVRHEHAQCMPSLLFGNIPIRRVRQVIAYGGPDGTVWPRCPYDHNGLLRMEPEQAWHHLKHLGRVVGTNRSYSWR